MRGRLKARDRSGRRGDALGGRRRGGLRSALCALALAGATLTVGAVTASPATAASGSCTSTGSGGTVITDPGVSGSTITLSQTVHFIGTHYCPDNSTTIGDSSWTPPACWWAPVFNPQELKDWANKYYSSSSSADLTWEKLTHYYETDGGLGETRPAGYKSTDGPPYSDWNIGAAPAGTWWSIVFNIDMVGTAKFDQCLNETMDSHGVPWTWVPRGAPDPAAGAAGVVSQEDIALYAASKIELPPADFSSDPLDKQTVNLPMWVWAGDAAHHPFANVNLTGCVRDLDGNQYACATVTASARSFTVDPGTPNDGADAVVYTNCPVNPNGTVGTPYHGQSGLPDCGVKYLHSTPGGELYRPSVTVKWSVAWDGGGGAGWPKPVTMAGLPHNMQVQEIQTIVGQ